MQTPEVFLAYTPRGAGLRCAVAYLADERDVYGWFTGPQQDLAIASRYFLIEDFYGEKLRHYETVGQGDLHAHWALDESRRHALAQMQEAFAREWLMYHDDPHALAELQAYAEAELAAGEVFVRYERLGRFSAQQPTWTFYSKHFERKVLRELQKHWPLEYRLHEESSKVQRERRTPPSCF